MAYKTYYQVKHMPILNTVDEYPQEINVDLTEQYDFFNKIQESENRIELYPTKKQAENRIKELQEKPDDKNIELLRDLITIAREIIRRSQKVNLENPGLPSPLNQPTPSQVWWLAQQITNNFQLSFSKNHIEASERIIKNLQNFIEESTD